MEKILTILKRLLVFILLFSSTSYSLASPGSSANGPFIELQVEGYASGTAYLIGIAGDQNFSLDSTAIAPDGRIVFRRAEPYPSGLAYLLLPDQNYLQLLLVEDQQFSMKTRGADLVNAMEVSGSLDNELLYQSLQFESKMQPRFEEIARQMEGLVPGTPAHQEAMAKLAGLLAERKDYFETIFEKYPDAFFTTLKKGEQNPGMLMAFKPDGTPDTGLQLYLYRNEFWNNVDFSDDRLLRTPVIINKLQRYITELTTQHPDSIKQSAALLINQVLDRPEYYKFFTNWIALHYEPGRTTLMDAEAVYVYLIQNYVTHERAFWADSLTIDNLQERALDMASSLIGQVGPEVKAKDPNGTLRSIHGIEAPYIVVYLYNPNCDHCMEETPRLVDFYQEWKNRGVEVYAIALDTEEKEWKDFIRQNKMRWINVFDPTYQAIYRTYYVDNTPEVYVLNPDRVIIGKNLKVSQVEEVIRRDQLPK